MCLEVFAKLEPHAQDKIGARRLADTSNLYVRKRQAELGPAFHFCAVAPGQCSCDLLGKGNTDAVGAWNLKTEHLEGLARAVTMLAKEVRDFTFCAHWLGEEFEPPQRVKAAALVNLIRSNSVGRNTPY